MTRGTMVVVVLGLVACGDNGDAAVDAAPPDAPTDAAPDAMPDAAPPFLGGQFVTPSIVVPMDAQQAALLGRDLDGDGTVDNQLGNVVAALFQGGGQSVGAATAAAVTAGDILWLHDIGAESAAGTIWRVFQAAPTPQPDLDGGGTFALDPEAPTTDSVAGMIANRRFLGTGGTARVELAFVASQVSRLDLHAVVIDAAVDTAGCDGVIAGGIPIEDIDGEIVVGIHAFIVDVIASDPGCPDACEPGGNAETMLGIFDGDGDGVITLDEVRTNSLVVTLLRPDLDLDHDATNDHLSLGVGFTCVPATFPVP